MRSKALISALVLALLLAVAPAAGAALPKLATQLPEHELQVRPPVISYTGDGTGFVGGRKSAPLDGTDSGGGIHWQSWTPRSAFGRGWAWVNDCRPDCASGSFHKARATVRATRPRGGLFTRMVIAYRWGGQPIHDHRVLERAGGYWYWGV